MKVQKRAKLRIYFDVLKVLREELKENAYPSLTRVAHQSNLPYDRFRDCLEHLIQVGMVSRGDEKLIVTDKGCEFIQEFEKIIDFLKRMGLLP
jgi:predicted transcriptional regulator